MKKLLLLMLFITATLAGNSLFAQQYHEDDKEGLRHFLRQPSYNSSRYNFQLIGLSVADTLDWHNSEEWINIIYFRNRPVTWNDENPKRIKELSLAYYLYGGILDGHLFPELEILYCEHSKISELNLSGNSKLKDLSCTGTLITDLDVSNNTILSRLSCARNNMTSIDVSNNTLLQSFECFNNKLTSLDLSNNPNLARLDCSNNQLTSLDLSANNLLAKLNCEYNKITNLELRDKPSLYLLNCRDNELQSLSIYNCPNLDIISCSHNYLNISQDVNTDNPEKVKDSYLYVYPQNIILRQQVREGDIFDIRDNYWFKGMVDCMWYDSNMQEIELPYIDNGVFVAVPEYSDQIIRCYIYSQNNGEFLAEHEVFIEKIPVPAFPSLTSNLLFRKSSGERLYSVIPGEQFNMYVAVNEPDSDVRIGLFYRNNNSFVEDVTVSINGNTYTCMVSDNVYSDHYVLQPYVMTDGVRQLISRPVSSHIIDRLPLQVEDDWGWEFSAGVLKSSASSLTRTMQVSMGYNLEIACETSFGVMVNASPSNPGIKVGLFNWSSGQLVANITTSVRNSTYTCKVPMDVLSGNYILIPYEEVDGQVVFIERPTDANHIIDRLPLYVNNTIWGVAPLSVEENEVEAAGISVSPNPTTGLVNLGAVCERVEVYNTSGALIKTYNHTATVDLGDCPNSVYMLKVTAGGKTFGHKIIKR